MIDPRSPRWNLLAEILILCTVLTTLVLMEFGILPDFQNIGFYCDDPKIKFKFTGETITSRMLLLVTTILPLAIITCVEWGCHGPEGYAKRGGGRWAWLTQSLRWYREFISGLLIVFFIADVAKVLIGEPRPHFLDTCKPFQAVNCSSGYVSRYTCTNKELNMWRVRDASRSFPSGHAAISFYLFTFMAWFLERRVISMGKIVVAWLQMSVLLWTIFCSLSRITDRRHHWWDVLAGSILGVIVGHYTVRKFCRDFQLQLYRSHMSGAKQIQNENSSRPLYNDNASARRLLTSTSSYNNEPPTQDRSDPSLT